MLPVSELTVTFMFDHDAHTSAYHEIMRKHCNSRQEFVRALNAYLADPANRH